MSPAARKILEDALALSEEARVHLATVLLESVDHEPPDTERRGGVGRRGQETAGARSARGAVKSVSWEEAEALISAKMARRLVDVHPEAIAETREARQWYRDRRLEVEERFRRALLEGGAFRPREPGTLAC